MGSFSKFQIAIVSIKLSAKLNYNGSKISRKLMELFSCEVIAFTTKTCGRPRSQTFKRSEMSAQPTGSKELLFTMLQVFNFAALMENVLAFLILMNKGVAM